MHAASRVSVQASQRKPMLFLLPRMPFGFATSDPYLCLWYVFPLHSKFGLHGVEFKYRQVLLGCMVESNDM